MYKFWCVHDLYLGIRLAFIKISNEIQRKTQFLVAFIPFMHTLFFIPQLSDRPTERHLDKFNYFFVFFFYLTERTKQNESTLNCKFTNWILRIYTQRFGGRDVMRNKFKREPREKPMKKKSTVNSSDSVWWFVRDLHATRYYKIPKVNFSVASATIMKFNSRQLFDCAYFFAVQLI